MNVYGLRDLSHAVNACVPQISVSSVPGAYFTLVERPVPVQKRKKTITCFFLSSEVLKNGQSKFTLRAKHFKIKIF